MMNIIKNTNNKQIIGRKQQIKEIQANIILSQETGKGKKIIISGNKGTGKTSTTHTILTNHTNKIYIDCSIFNTAYMLSAELHRIIFNDKELIMKGSNTLKLIRDVYLKLDITQQQHIIICDNVEYVKNSKDFKRVQDILTKKHILIFIYNETYNEGIKFPNYTTQEKQEILKHLLEINKIDKEIIKNVKISNTQTITDIIDEININILMEKI